MEQNRAQKPGYPLQLAGRVPAVEEHGRAVTANPRAAAWYRQAQRAVDCRRATGALELAVTADSDFVLAIADLEALSGGTVEVSVGRQMNWERHHVEVVRTAAAGDASRATDLLREHLANVGCDPIAHRILVHLRHRWWTTADRFPTCHPIPWTCCQ